MNELLRLLDDELVAVANGDFALADSAREELRRAQPNKQLLLERLQAHVEEHGCSSVPLANALEPRRYRSQLV
jgi:hypothetical protein